MKLYESIRFASKNIKMFNFYRYNSSWNSKINEKHKIKFASKVKTTIFALIFIIF